MTCTIFYTHQTNSTCPGKCACDHTHQMEKTSCRMLLVPFCRWLLFHVQNSTIFFQMSVIGLLIYNKLMIPFGEDKTKTILFETKMRLKRYSRSQYLIWLNTYWHIKCQCCPHLETSQLICTADQLSGFYEGNNGT